MDIDATFLPIAVELIDNVFPTQVVYRREGEPTYDYATGEVVLPHTEVTIKAGVLSSGLNEEGGANQGRNLRLWLHHGPGGISFIPLTADRVRYLDVWWKVTAVEPSFHSNALIASKLTLNQE